MADQRDLPAVPDFWSELDRRFGELMMELSGGRQPDLFLAAALASHGRAAGNICCDLSTLAGRPLGGEGSPVCPDLKPWLAILESVPVVGKPGEYRPLILEGSRLYLYRYWEYEKKLAEFVIGQAQGQGEPFDPAILQAGLARYFPDEAGGEPDWQKVAAVTSVLKKWCVIAGGPGTGKTFTVAKILALLLEQPGGDRKKIALAAPTGKAAARLQESILKAGSVLPCSETIKELLPGEASTIHRLLKRLPDSPYFRHHSRNPLTADVVIVDEASMVDLALLSKLVQALSPEARLILLGDKDQLASVEAGAVLGDLCDTGRAHGYSASFRRSLEKVAGVLLPETGSGTEDAGLQDSIVELRKSYRFGADSGIRQLSRAVNAGHGAEALKWLKGRPGSDIHWRELPRPEFLASEIREPVTAGLSAYLKETDPTRAFEAFNRWRILCALRKGPYGVEALNLWVERNLQAAGLIQGERRWYRGRPVMITRNDYTLRLFNGDVGLTWPDPEAGGELQVFFQSPEGELRRMPPLRLPDHETVYAMTVHKSQGSEFDQVLFLLPDRMAPVLTRELVYTALTRARERVEVWGREEIFRQAVSRRIERTSGLRETLWGRDKT